MKLLLRGPLDILGGEPVNTEYPSDDLQYAEDLGLIVTWPQLGIANGIYQQMIPRELTRSRQATITHQTEWYVRPDHSLDIPKLLTEFQQFFRENADISPESFDKEAGPQLLMQSFLDRIVNGGGRVIREYALGGRRTDLFLEWPLDKTTGLLRGPTQKVVLELKILRKGAAATIAKGLEQTADYADSIGVGEAHLLIFDRRKGKSWEERIWHRTESVGKRAIGVWGM